MSRNEDREALASAAREAEARPIRRSKLDVIEYTPSDPRSQKQLAAPGTITIYFAKKGAPVLDEIRKAAHARGGADSKLAARIAKTIERLRRVSIAEAVEQLRGQPVFADVDYGGRLLATSVFVRSASDVIVLFFPYNGGRLARSGFTLVEHYLAADASMDGLVLMHAPPLTKAERSALERIRADQLALNVGDVVISNDDEGGWTFVAAVALTIAAAVVACPGVAVAEAVGAGVAVVEGLEAVAADLAVAGTATVVAAVTEETAVGDVGANDAALEAAAAAAGEAGLSRILQATIRRAGQTATAKALMSIRRDLLSTKKGRSRIAAAKTDPQFGTDLLIKKFGPAAIGRMLLAFAREKLTKKR